MGLLLGSGTTKPQYPYDQWYGVQGDFTSKDKKLTRVGNMDLHRTLPIQSKLKRFVENPDGSVKYYLHQNDSRKKDSGAAAVIDSTDGNVMLEKPEYYFRMEFEGTKWLRAYSEYPLPGFIKMGRKTCSPWYASVSNGVAISGCWLTWSGNEIARDSNGLIVYASGAPRGGSGAAWDGTYRSLIGMPKTSVSKANVRGYCKNGTHHGVGRIFNEIAWLQRVEYASWDCQDAYNATLTADGFHQGGLGYGPAVNSGEWNTHNGYNPYVPCGVTATLGNNTGRVNFTIKNWQGAGSDKVVQVTSYRGLEAPFEYLWLLADDLLVYHSPDTAENRSTIYMCEDPTKFAAPADNAAESQVPDGYVSMTDLPRAGGWILQHAHSGKGYSFPESIGGSGNTGTCDYFWHPGATASGWYGALLAASADYGTCAGFGCLYTTYRSSHAYAYTGFRLCRF